MQCAFLLLLTLVDKASLVTLECGKWTLTALLFISRSPLDCVSRTATAVLDDQGVHAVPRIDVTSWHWSIVKGFEKKRGRRCGINKRSKRLCHSSES